MSGRPHSPVFKPKYIDFLPNLVSLADDGNHLSNQDLSKRTNFPRMVLINNHQVTDEGVLPLTRLKSLYLQSTPLITKKKIPKLATSLNDLVEVMLDLTEKDFLVLTNLTKLCFNVTLLTFQKMNSKSYRI